MEQASHLLMIRPVHFGFNPQTAVNNAFQQTGHAAGAQEKAVQEFDAFIRLLQENDIDVTVISDSPEPHTPDAIFPNNWISFHENGTMVLYPMYAANRRLERKPAVMDAVQRQFTIAKTIDLSYYEKENAFLEGTGSMVLDRKFNIAYACLSPRTHYQVLQDFCEQMGYTAVVFDAFDQDSRSVYHTNVMMCVADAYVVICLDAIAARHEQEEVAAAIRQSGKTIIPISQGQMNHFAGNMLQVYNRRGTPLLVMSSQAYDALTYSQRRQLESYNAIIHTPLTTIEANGGGSARCMLAEVFLPPNKS